MTSAAGSSRRRAGLPSVNLGDYCSSTKPRSTTLFDSGALLERQHRLPTLLRHRLGMGASDQNIRFLISVLSTGALADVGGKTSCGFLFFLLWIA